MKHKLIIFFVLFSSVASAQLAQKPPMGWNSFDSYGVYLHEKAAYENLEVFAQKLKPFGYEYFVFDAGWYGEFKLIPGTLYPSEKHAENIAMDKYGRLEPSKTYFPNGIIPIIERAHQLGVKFGIHLMRGIPRKAYELNLPVLGTPYKARDIADTTSICTWNNQNYGVDMTKPGAQEYYNSVYRKMAEWGVDFVKVDDLLPYPKELIAVGKAVKESGRPMLFSLSPGGSFNLKDLPYYTVCNMVRITADIWDEQKAIDNSFKAWRTWQGIGHPGFWPDLDMIPFGMLQVMKPKEYISEGANALLAGVGFKRQSQFTESQMRTFITQRALASSPLIMGGDLPTLDDFSLKLITNSDMIECNQNGHSATLISDTDSLEIWGTCVPDIQMKGWIGFFNRSSQLREINLSKESMRLVTYYGKKKMEKQVRSMFSVKDIWNNQNYKLDDGQIKLAVRPGDVLFVKYTEILEDIPQ